MIDYNVGRTWGNAPSGVRDARALAWLGVIGSGFMVIGFFALLATVGAKAGALLGLLLIYTLFFPLYIWLLVAFKRGTKSAYYVQMVMAIIGLIGFPLGTIINAYILFKWFKPETKAWFGV